MDAGVLSLEGRRNTIPHSSEGQVCHSGSDLGERMSAVTALAVACIPANAGMQAL
jgi:hypothetical protein